ncbi:MAG: helix-turn-helix domain-containing protein [Rickettsiales bacterium]|nr:helix-turn-helix domain-containing protein [Rickettsiales bacterium]
MNISMPPFNDYRDIGRMLHDTRESMGIALEDVAKQLRVRYKYLQSLEKGEIGEIPGDVYARGYLKMYADFLGYNGQQMITHIHAPSATQSTQYLPPERAEHSRSTVLILVACILALLAIVIWQVRENQQTQPVNLVQSLPLSQEDANNNQDLSLYKTKDYLSSCQKDEIPSMPSAICNEEMFLTSQIQEDEPVLSIMEWQNGFPFGNGRL